MKNDSCARLLWGNSKQYEALANNNSNKQDGEADGAGATIMAQLASSLPNAKVGHGRSERSENAGHYCGWEQGLQNEV